MVRSLNKSTSLLESHPVQHLHHSLTTMQKKRFVSVYWGKHSNNFTQSHCNEPDMQRLRTKDNFLVDSTNFYFSKWDVISCIFGFSASMRSSAALENCLFSSVVYDRCCPSLLNRSPVQVKLTEWSNDIGNLGLF